MRSRTHAITCAMLMTALTSTRCDQPQPPAPAPAPATTPVTPSAEQAQALREVYGLPLPPRVRSIKRRELTTLVETDMRINALEEHLTRALRGSEFEVLRVQDTLRVVGLRSGMPSLEAAYIRGNRTNIMMIYHLIRPEEGYKDLPDDKVPIQIQNMREPYKYGEEVKLRTPDGKLLAPGARWGLPYTPPPGSPLHTRRHSSNWGRPFGAWTPD